MRKKIKEVIHKEISEGECSGIMKRTQLSILTVDSVCCVLGLAFPVLWPALFITAGLSALGLTGLAFLLIDRRVEHTMEQVDDTIVGLMEKRRTEYFSSCEDSLLGKFQSQICRLHEILCAQEEREKLLRVRLNESLSNLVHQINTPITNLMVYSGFLEQENLKEGDRLKFARRIRQQAQKLSFLGEGFSRLSRLETGIIVVCPVCQEILPVLLGAVSQVEPKAEVGGNGLALEGDEKLCACLDAKWTEEVFFNLLDNAVKYGRPGGKITIRLEAFELYVKVDLCNEGDPIPAEEYPRIFQRFERGKNAQAKEGVGLGLYLSREIIKRQGGYIRAGFDRERGETVFSVFLRKQGDDFI